ncbi:hypothetical protein MTQ01_21075 [Streptomyces sp. XM4193]|uniref:hypothetical protein n=1 Tax=Streptomyces sp. XM4193 TaxID=2929782 RepID=UPI001FFBF624|nr:hypothetical protein [Streptomyces sp. XM4193]MCK1798473.1 hypothetical protein [Streptomyces sp. XM4193]
MVHDGVDGVDPDGRDRIELVQHLCESGRLDEAHALLDDDWVRAAGSLGYLLRAYVHALRGSRAESREATDWALLHLDGDPVDQLCLAGQVLLALGDEHRALTIGRRALAADPHDWRPRVLLADAYRELDRIQESVTLARHAVDLAPEEVEAQLALARSLSLRQALPGQRRRELTSERDRAWARAAELGADEAALAGARPPWWRRFRWLPVVVIFLGLQVVAGIDWRLAIGVLCTMLFALIGLWWVSVLRVGARPADRVQAARAATRAELFGHPGQARAVELAVAAVLPLVPLFTTGFVAAAASDGQPWPALAALCAGLGAAAAVVGGGLLLRWWYGERVWRERLLHSPYVERRLALVLLLSGGTVAMALGGVGGGWWDAVFLAHLLFVVVGSVRGVWRLAVERNSRVAG